MKRILTGIAALTAMTVLAACGGTDATRNASAEPKDADGNTTLRVGLVPVVNVAPLYVGMEQGFFEEEGLVLEPTIAQTFAANVASVSNGETHVGFGATVPILVAASNGVPLRIVGTSDVAGPAPDGDNSGLFVADGADIDEIGDLEGKTVAINALSNVHDVAIKSAMIDAGADPTQVKFLEVALPDMVAALQAKRVDAIAVGEPFVTAARAAGFDMLLRTYTEGYEQGTPIGSYFTSSAWAKDNPELVTAFQTALERSAEYAAANPDAARAVMEKYTQIPPEVLAKVTLGTFSATVDNESLEALAGLMVETGTIKSEPDIAAVTGGQ